MERQIALAQRLDQGLARSGPPRVTTRGLALDLGSTTGWAADDPRGGDIPLAGLWDCSHRNDELGEAFCELELKLITAIRRLDPAYVAFEAAITPAWGKTNRATSQKLLGLGAIVQATAFKLSVPVYEVNLMTARRYMVGNGRAGKSDIWHACKVNRWPAFDLNATDAICVLVYSRSCFGVQQILGKTVHEKAQG